MKNLLKYLFVPLVIFSLIQCSEDTITKTTGMNELEATEHVSFQLLITDTDNKEIEGAILELSNTTYTSDEYGFVIIDNIDIPLMGLKITLDHSGYFKQVKMLTGRSNSKNTQQIRLVKESPGIDIETGSQGEISGQVLITLPPSLIDESGVRYTGRVQVKSHYFDPESADELADAPGNMLALTTENEYQLLATLGMITVELSTFQGQSLSIPDGEKATLSFPIASSQADLIPSEIPLWYFDENIGIWQREGQAILENNRMVAEVAHFTTWNCDIPYDFEEGCIQFVDVNGEPLPNLNASFYVQNTIFFGCGTTDANGFICNRLPLNQEIKIDIYLGDHFVESQIIGTFSSFDTYITVTVSTTLGKITGNALDCDGQKVTNGFGLLKYLNNRQRGFFFNSDGSFSVRTIVENQELTLINQVGGFAKIVSVSEVELSTEMLLIDVILCEFIGLGTVSGYVMFDNDEDDIPDSPMEGVKVGIRIEGLQGEKYTNTDSEGYYQFDLIPEEYYITLRDLSDQYIVSCSDFTIDDSFDRGNSYHPAWQIRCVLERDESDEDNNFTVVNNGFGTISGKVMIDLDGDNIGDRTPEGFIIYHGTSPIYNTSYGHHAISDESGNFIFSNIPTGWGDLDLGVDNLMFDVISAEDDTPDPERDQPGINNSIPVRLINDEIDADNNFLISIPNSLICCKVLLDYDQDGIGERLSFRDRDISLYKRNSLGFPTGNKLSSYNRTTIPGGFYIQAPIVDPGEYVLVYEENSTFILIASEDQISDNNPTNITGDPKYLPFNIVGKEYDDGLTFIVQNR